MNTMIGITLTLLAFLALFISACSTATSTPYPAPGQQTPGLPTYPVSEVSQPASSLYPPPLHQTQDIYPAPPGNQTPLPATPPAGSAAAVLAAMESLAQITGIPVDDISLIAVEDVEWPDGCLGIYQPGQMCTQAIVPGYRVILQADGQRYEFHTDRTGRQVILASPSRPQGSSPSSGQAPILEWALIQDGQCQGASIRLVESIQEPAINSGLCDKPQVNTRFTSPERLADLELFASRYAPFEAQTPAGQLIFFGNGAVTATPAEQRMIAEWARLVAQEAQVGRSDAPLGLAFTWQRTGGLAGFCDELSVYLSGEALGSSCKGSSAANLGRTRLLSSQLERLYDWFDQLEPFQASQKDEAVADAMQVQVDFFGRGKTAASATDQQAMQELASQVWGHLNTPQEPAQIEQAQQALIDYFSALSAGDYASAATYFGGSAESLVSMNPDLDPTDLGGLLTAYYTINGGVCNLSVRNWVDAFQSSADTFVFSLEFETAKGDLFKQGPCCDEDPSQNPPHTRFDYTVVREGERFQVLDLPIYVP